PPDVPQIVVVSPIASMRTFAESISVFGYPLTEVLPIGNLTPDGDVSYWSPKFGTSRPLVLVIPDVDRACEYVEGSDKPVSLTIVDATGHNAARTASICRLESLNARVLVVTSQAEADESGDADTKTVFFEWEA